MDLKYLKLYKTDLKSVIIHTLQSPEEGEASNAQIIETTNKLVIIDTLQLKPFAEELKSYAKRLNKPIDRVYVTHYHPDHWMGTATFKDFPMYAFKEVIDKISAMYDFVIGFHTQRLAEKANELLPSEKILPALEVNEGIIEIDGLKLNMIKSVESEAPVVLVVELPDFGVLLAQDLVYYKNHAWFGDRTSEGKLGIDNWISDLKKFQLKNYKYVIPGHGIPTDSSVFQTLIEYLEFCKQKYNDGLKGEELINSIKNKYPEYELDMTLQMTNYMLFEFNG